MSDMSGRKTADKRETRVLNEYLCFSFRKDLHVIYLLVIAITCNLFKLFKSSAVKLDTNSHKGLRKEGLRV